MPDRASTFLVDRLTAPATTRSSAVPCGPGCVYAALMPAPYFDWVRCTRPGGSGAWRTDVHPCRHFRTDRPGAAT